MNPRWPVLAGLAALCLGLAALLMTRSDEPPVQPFRYDRSRPLDISREKVGAPIAGVQLERVTFSSSDGERVPATLLSPAAPPSDPQACLIFMNGYGTNSADSVGSLAPIALAGVPVLVLDARLNGTREPRPGARAASIRTGTSAAAVLRASVVDVRRAIDVLGTDGTCDPSRIGVVGVSQGAIIMTMVAATDPRVAASVLLMPSPDARAARTALRRIQPGALEDLAEAERNAGPWMPVRWLPRIESDRPVLLVRGAKDELVPIAASKALFALARRERPQTKLWVSPGGHDPFGGPAAAVVARRILSFLSEHLKVDDLGAVAGLAAVTPPYRARDPLEVKTRTLRSPSRSVRLQRVRFTSSDGARVPALVLLPRGRRAPGRSCLIAMGGSGTSAPELAKSVGVLTDAGIPALVLDARLNGERRSKGASLAEAARNPLQAAAAVGGSVVDVRRSIDVLRRTGRCSRRGIALVGVTEAGYVMLAAAGADDRVRTTVLFTGAGDAAAKAPGRPEAVGRAAMARVPQPPEAWLQQARRDGGILVLRSTSRQLVPLPSRSRYLVGRRTCGTLEPAQLNPGTSGADTQAWTQLLGAGAAGWRPCRS